MFMNLNDMPKRTKVIKTTVSPGREAHFLKHERHAGNGHIASTKRTNVVKTTVSPRREAHLLKHERHAGKGQIT